MDSQRGMTDQQLADWAQAHTGGGQESSVAIGVQRLLAEKAETVYQQFKLSIFKSLAQILTNTEKIMATQADLDAEVKTIKGQLDAVVIGITGLQATIATLNATIAAGGTITPQLQSDTDALLTEVNSIVASLPTPPPVVPPPVGP